MKGSFPIRKKSATAFIHLRSELEGGKAHEKISRHDGDDLRRALPVLGDLSAGRAARAG